MFLEMWSLCVCLGHIDPRVRVRVRVKVRVRVRVNPNSPMGVVGDELELWKFTTEIASYLHV